MPKLTEEQVLAKAQKSVIFQGVAQVVFTLIPAAVLFGLHGAHKGAQCENPLENWLWRYAWLMVGLVFAFIPTFLISFLIMRKAISAEAGAIATCVTTCCVLLPVACYAFYWYIQGNIWVWETDPSHCDSGLWHACRNWLIVTYSMFPGICCVSICCICVLGIVGGVKGKVADGGPEAGGGLSAA
jgi:hypothetical protein